MASQFEATSFDFTENLWLLSKIRILELQRNEPKDFNALVVLDAVALFLTNGHPDGHIATFYDPNTTTLYLAKSGPADPGDNDIVTAFLAEINTATKFKDLLPFLARRSGAYVNERIQQLRQHFDQSQFEVMRDMAEKKQDQKFSRALEVCTGLLASNVPFSEAPEACQNFRDLVFASRTICDRFRSWLYRWRRDDPLKDLWNRLEILWDRLETMSQYAGAKRLIKWWNRHGSKIQVCWVPDTPTTTAASYTLNPRIIADKHIEDLFKPYRSEPVRSDNIKERMLKNMDARYPGWRDPTSLLITSHLHVEIRLILFLTTHGIDGISPQSPISELIIGCSERICYCCSLWIKAFNAAHGMKWVTKSGSGYVRYDWLSPDATGVVYDMEVGFHDDIAEGVERRLVWFLRRRQTTILEIFDGGQYHY